MPLKLSVIEVGRGSIFLHRKYVINKKIRKKEMAKITIDIPDYTETTDKDGNKVYKIRQTIGEEYSPYCKINELEMTVYEGGNILITDLDDIETMLYIYADQVPVILDILNKNKGV
jgi:hypothetical protein